MTCPICNDDGWVDIPDEETGGVSGSMECPRLHHLGHASFNATGLLPAAFDDAAPADPAALHGKEPPTGGYRKEPR